MVKRIQRRRTKGWRMPDGAVYVGRPTKWGNPFAVGVTRLVGPPHAGRDTMVTDQRAAVGLYRQWLMQSARRHDELVRPLAGHDLACWCPLDQMCHADVLLQIANGEGGPR